MPSQPLRPLAAPTALTHIVNVAPGSIVLWFLLAVFVFWAIYTLIAIYHWYKYAHAPGVAHLALMTHLGVSAACLLLALSGVVFS